MKIYIQTPPTASDSPYYKFLRVLPPKEIEYINANKLNLLQNKNKLKLNNWIKNSAKKLVRKLFPTLPNAYFTISSEKYDIIHCGHCLSLNKNIPWVADIEYVGQFFMSTPFHKLPSKTRVENILYRNNCKKIIAWSKWSMDNILKEFPKLKEKIEIVYPAVPVRKFIKKKIDKIRLLFVGRDFYLKGGNIAVKVMNELSNKYKNVEGVIVSDVPEEIINKYSTNKKIIFHKLMTHEKLFANIYPSCDIFIYPTYLDTLGFAILEAQSFGLPVIAQKTPGTYTLTETITNNKTGFIIENKKTRLEFNLKKSSLYEEFIIPYIILKTSKLIENPKLLNKMSKNCIKEIKDGKFSIKERNKKMKRIYNESFV